MTRTVALVTGRAAVRAVRTVAALLTLWGLLTPAPTAAELPATPDAAIVRLQQVLSEQDLEGYSELLAVDFVFSPPEALGLAPLDRQQELDAMRRFFAGVSRFDVTLEIESQASLPNGVSLNVSASLSAVDEMGDGYRVDYVHVLSLVELPTGWCISAWADTPATETPPDRVRSWYQLRQALAAEPTHVRPSTWSDLKRLHR